MLNLADVVEGIEGQKAQSIELHDRVIRMVRAVEGPPPPIVRAVTSRVFEVRWPIRPRGLSVKVGLTAINIAYGGRSVSCGESDAPRIVSEILRGGRFETADVAPGRIYVPAGRMGEEEYDDWVWGTSP